MRPHLTLVLCLALAVAVTAQGQVTCPSPLSPLQPGPSTIKAEIAAIDQPYFLNRYGAAMPQGMMFALKRDLVPIPPATTLAPGQVMLRPGKRPRPIVLRVRQGDCLQVTLWNYLAAPPSSLGTFGVATTTVSFHVNGLNVLQSIASDGSLVGANTPPSGNLAPSSTNKIDYLLYAAQTGTFLAYSNASTTGGSTTAGGQITAGLFGSVHVEPPGGEMYRSQVTQAALAAAQSGTTSQGQPLISNYLVRYPATWSEAALRCAPVLAMVAPGMIPSGTTCVSDPANPGLITYYTDLTAVITGPNQGNFTANTPDFNPVPATPNRRQPYREFTIHYQEVLTAVQALPQYYWNNDPDPTGVVNDLMATVAGPGADNFGINYGTGGIGTEIFANRLNIGPNAGPPGSNEAACVECKFEEFFLSAWAVGDPAMVVDVPANSPSSTPIAPNANLNNVAYLNQLTQCALNQNAASCNSLLTPGQQYYPQIGRKAQTAYFADDPSNVYHSYLNDHVTFRILHAGMNFTHVHHQHAHQWLHSPNSPNGSYLDSQLISPGSAFTLEMVYNGSGNRNKTAGDSIFHCHFYPHFAAGMWSMWRVHDVFESGTKLNSAGQPLAGARALPDGEIAAGTPIPAIVPLPTLPMAPIPGANVALGPICAPNVSPCTNAQALGFKANITGSGNPGYPFFIPGVGGHRPPRPPLDVACEVVGGVQKCYDGGLQRHIILAGTVVNEYHNEWDFSKDNFIAQNDNYMTGTGSIYAQQLNEAGEPVEKAAMAYMGTRNHASFTPSNAPGNFVTNGLPRGPVPGAPFADPAIDDNGNPVGTMRRYKAADIQTDAAFNKSGWHYPQQRFITLWGDVANTLNGTRAPEPFFFRANSQDDFVEFWSLNLVPSYYDLDDYQVRTPTDILGQHIHLVKFDVTSSDGAANGFNYEDGTLSPDEVRDRIGAIRNYNSCTQYDSRNGTFPCPIAQAPPINVTPPPEQNWLGAQVTIQRWYADPLTGCVDGRVVNCNQNADRTLRTVFTHDHFGPSTHQQTGLYAGLLIEPQGTTWTDPITGQQLGAPSVQPSRYFDGGPTSWQALISANAQQPGFREFALEFQDLAHIYEPTSRKTQIPYTPNYPTTSTGLIIQSPTPMQAWGWTDCANIINGPNGGGFPSNCWNTLGSGSGNPNTGYVLPGLIDASQGLGTLTVNYRNEPLGLRIASGSNTLATDLAHVYQSMTRNTTVLNTQPNTCFDGTAKPCANGAFSYPGPFPGAQPTDPYTPLLQAYQGDNVQVRILVGAHFFNHNFGMQGLNWLFEPSNGSSGWRDNQAMGISEHFENLLTIPSTALPTGTTPGGVLPFADYLYTPGSGTIDQNAGMWGILRAYTTGGNSSKLMSNLKPAPNNPNGGTPWNGSSICPTSAPIRTYNVAAINGTARTYYNRGSGTTQQLVQNATPLLYVPATSTGTPSTTSPTAPLVLRANAGECVQVTLWNKFTTSGAPFTTAGSSTYAGIHPQLVTTNAARDNGVNVGFNPTQYRDTTAAPGNSIQYQWYAGNINFASSGIPNATPIEFGSAGLIAADPLLQQPYGLIGSLIVEPPSTIWCNTSKTLCSGSGGVTGNIAPVYDTTVDVYQGTSLRFREFVAMVQDNIQLTTTLKGTVGKPVASVSVNFGTEPMRLRFGATGADFNTFDMSSAFSNYMLNPTTGQVQGTPQTPTFTATAGTPVRFRMLHPDGQGGFPDNVFTLHGHVWQEEPYINDASGNPSALLGNNALSQWFGSRDGFGAGNHFDILLPSAGGPNRIAGDYLYGSFPVQRGPGTSSAGLAGGLWGVFTVTPAGYTAEAMPGEPAALAAAQRPATAPVVDPAERFKTPSQKRDEEAAGEEVKGRNVTSVTGEVAPGVKPPEVQPNP